MNHNMAHVREALARVVEQMAEWNETLALLAVKAARQPSAEDRKAMRRECERLNLALSEARMQLLTGLECEPQAISGHSRVVDVERALDGLSERLTDVSSQLAR
jgi:hypothetical protein